MLRWIIPIVLYILIDIYAFQAIKTISKNHFIHGVYVLSSVAILVFFIYAITSPDARTNPKMMYVYGLFLALFVPKIIAVVVMFGEDVIRVFVGVFYKIGGGSDASFMPSRRKFVSTVALGVAAIPFAALLYGMIKGKYNYKVLQYTLEFEDLPSSFDGYTLTQISDIHSGSFDNPEKVKYAVDLVNKQQSDLILFTGDLVNNVAQEMDAWKDTFATLKAKDGVYSVLGNHDYGDYVSWESAEKKQENLQALIALQKDMGWDVLLNESRTIKKNQQAIKLVGVENWGEGGFKKAGDLEKACADVSAQDFTILMSHDPSHWQSRVKEHPKNIQLTLSGHTHGMQFGIEIPGWFKWSPVKYRYQNWAGIYKEFGRYINVNRGFGYLGYPGRVGIWPEVTVITLKKKSKTA
ncbi:MAG: metallophosphoesterase [Patiriisocius sp.]